jgi:hypothetical protein
LDAIEASSCCEKDFAGAESKPQALKRDPHPRSGGTSELVPFPFTGDFLFPDLFVS